jgi:dTDP-4-dehydrorhamnose 3,5-epimerase
MKVEPTDIDGVLTIEPDVFSDPRGFFLETYNSARYAAAGLAETFVQDNLSFSTRDTLRGLHAQFLAPQGKLVRVGEGEVFDVAVDIRVGSPTFLRWVGKRLSAKNQLQLYIPPGFAHGFCVLSERAQVEYKCTELYDSEDAGTIAWDDPEIGIEWPTAEPLLSDRDRSALRVRAQRGNLPRYRTG